MRTATVRFRVYPGANKRREPSVIRRGYCGGCDRRTFELRACHDGIARCFACVTFGEPDGDDL